MLPSGSLGDVSLAPLKNPLAMEWYNLVFFSAPMGLLPLHWSSAFQWPPGYGNLSGQQGYPNKSSSPLTATNDRDRSTKATQLPGFSPHFKDQLPDHHPKGGNLRKLQTDGCRFIVTSYLLKGKIVQYQSTRPPSKVAPLYLDIEFTHAPKITHIFFRLQNVRSRSKNNRKMLNPTGLTRQSHLSEKPSSHSRQLSPHTIQQLTSFLHLNTNLE